MSTKVYDVYKVKNRNDIWPLLREIQNRGRANVVQKLRDLYWKKMTFLDPESEDYQKKKQAGSSDWYTRLNLVHETLQKEFKANSSEPGRSFFDIEVYVNVFEHDSGFYLKVYCDQVSCLAGALDFVHRHRKVRDFSYDTRSDKPGRITIRDWAQRRRVWDELSDPSGLLRPIVQVPICNWNSFWTLDPFADLADKYRKNPPTFPLLEEAYAEDRLRGIEGIGEVRATKGSITTKDGTIKRGTKFWTTTFQGKKVKHPSLKSAVAYFKFKYAPEHVQHLVERMEARAKKRAPRINRRS